jgi:hypothetical protein
MISGAIMRPPRRSIIIYTRGHILLLEQTNNWASRHSNKKNQCEPSPWTQKEAVDIRVLWSRKLIDLTAHLRQKTCLYIFDTIEHRWWFALLKGICTIESVDPRREEYKDIIAKRPMLVDKLSNWAFLIAFQGFSNPEGAQS